MTARAGLCPASGHTVRPAEKGVTGCRRQQAREQVRAFAAGGRTVTELDAWLQSTFRIDPTGVTAVRNVARAGGASDAA